VIPKAMAEVHEVSAGKTRRASANAAGQFSLAGLPAGDYEVRVSSPGFQMASRQFRLVARDRAVLSVVLQVGAVTEMVVLDGAAGQGNMGAGGGVAGGLVLFEQMGLANKVARFARTDGAHLGTGSPAENEMALLTPSAGLTVREQTGVSPAAHVRSYFPEALYINPQIITDQNGAATISIPLADSITTWRMAMMASTIHGALGSGTAALQVFQDFFVDLDLPVTLTQGDRVEIPVAVYNYAGTKGSVRLQLQPDDWFSQPDDVSEKSLTVDIPTPPPRNCGPRIASD